MHTDPALVKTAPGLPGGAPDDPRVDDRESLDLVLANGKRIAELDTRGPRGQGEAFHALYGANGRIGKPLGASCGLRRASNGLEHVRRQRTVRDRLTETAADVGVRPLHALPWLS